jgi:colicin import membrane protein
MKKLLVFLVLLGPALSLRAQEAGEVAAEKARLAAQRAQAEQVFQAEEKACYAKFAVNDCVDAARAKRREALAGLRKQEIALNDAERQRKAAARLRDIEERNSSESQRSQAEQRAKALAEQRDRESRAAEKAAERAAREGRAEPAVREKGERDSAREQKSEQAERNRKQHEQRLLQAQERKAKFEKRLAERKKDAAPPLPVPR